MKCFQLSAITSLYDMEHRGKSSTSMFSNFNNYLPYLTPYILCIAMDIQSEQKFMLYKYDKPVLAIYYFNFEKKKGCIQNLLI